MLSLLLSPALTLTALASWDTPKTNEKDELGPPGLVTFKGGTTHVGSSKKDIEALLEAIPRAALALRPLDAETPQNRLKVDPFLLGLTEVTNQQYEVFVRANGRRPLQEWGREAIDAAAEEYLIEQHKRNEALRAEGKARVREPFKKGEWWEENWREAKWEVTEADALRPATYVSYADAVDYCKWAGVRLPTEFEFQHACRGSGKNIYPWGDEWEPEKYAGTNEIRGHAFSYVIGSFEAGKTKDGLFDLAGNVWEWTSSPYLPYDKFEKNEYRINGEKEKKCEDPKWDGNQRVAVGGSFQNTRLVARCTVRRPSDRIQMTNALGFRIAATPRVGVDIAFAVFDTEVQHSDARPSGVKYMPARAIAMDRWLSATASPDAPAGYGVIGGYEFAVFVPVEETAETADAGFRRLSLEGPRHLGYLSLSFPILEPELAAGTYLLAFRAQGEARLPVVEGEAQEGEQAAKPERVEDPLAGLIDIKVDNLLLFDAATAELAAHIPIQGVQFGKGDGGGSILPITKTFTVPDPSDPRGRKTMEVEEQWLRLDVRIPTKIRRHSLPIFLELKPDPAVLEKTWRR